MLIGVPREVKNHEYRVGLTPACVQSLTTAGHQVRVEQNAGTAIGFDDEQYRRAGAQLVDAATAYQVELVVKVKEPQPQEIPLLDAGPALFTYLHLAADGQLTRQLLEKNVIGIAYETVTDASGGLPLLTPMSEVAGRIALQAGAACLHMANGGRGTLLGGVPGVPPGRVVILGAGIVGTQAARMALGLGADVTILDINLARLRQLDDLIGPRIKTCYSQPANIAEHIASADLLIGAVLLPGKRAPQLLTADLIQSMPKGAAFVDVAIDQGGCSATSRPTSHANPTYVQHGIVHYCVSNIPAACARTSTLALTNATLPYVQQLANLGINTALKTSPALQRGLNLYRGELTHAGVAEDLGLPYCAFETLPEI